MGTSSVVGIKKNDLYTVIRVHYDGYLSYMGKLLLQYYDEPMLCAAIELGDANSLGETLNPLPKPSKWQIFKGDWIETRLYSNFYVRDMGGDIRDYEALRTTDIKKVFSYGSGVDTYIMENGVWYHANEKGIFHELTLQYIENRCDCDD